MGDQIEENRKLLVFISNILKKDGKTYNKTDIRSILKGEKKGYTPKYDVNISSGRLSGFLDALEVLGILEATEKNLYSLTESANDILKYINLNIKSDNDV